MYKIKIFEKMITILKVLIIVFSIQVATAHEIEHFFMPTDRELAEESILKAINNSKRSIDIAMFIFTNKKIAQALIKKSKESKQNSISVVVDNSYNNSINSKVNKLSKAKNIKLFLAQGLPKQDNKIGKMHAKLLIIDDETVYLGSTNLTKSAFSGNYEILIKIRDKTTAKLYKLYLNQILAEAELIEGTSNNDKL